ncbi:MAG: hypothetical protein AAB706_02890 [Patescibacteria group bacterium]
MGKWAYDYSNDELVKAVIQQAAQAGISNSGVMFDFTAGYRLGELRYLRGVLLARLDNVRPPFEIGQVVEARKGRYIYTVQRIFYEGSNKWILSFRGAEENQYYYAENFKKVDVPVKVR